MKSLSEEVFCGYINTEACKKAVMEGDIIVVSPFPEEGCDLYEFRIMGNTSTNSKKRRKANKAKVPSSVGRKGKNNNRGSNGAKPRKRPVGKSKKR